MTSLPLRSSRRAFLAGGVSLLVVGALSPVSAHSYSGQLPWLIDNTEPPVPVKPGGWYFFLPDEVALMSAICDRLIPADDLSPSGTDAGCVVFLDRQLAGPYGRAERLYMKGPFHPGLPTQGYQGPNTPAQRFRKGLAAIGKAVDAKTPGKKFTDWDAKDQDAFLTSLEKGDVKFGNGLDSKTFFAFMLENVMEGFFADPIYGGNKDMAGWKMIGFPGARYDYRAWVPQHNKPFTGAPISIAGSVQWGGKADK
ncbi:gluconate 2-dehydrogenase subunit 3 family protein [Acidimangrovimonas sediminis]|uniref:gluconate 2-dehydrogenase subunit 3 family protein n=1 Tax=Acidimangrovimonas sediminis TaxID=2056283 RepID=UPI000C802C9F|nr:gluconate 2-dehydrogenase subunit 3 family protein [Acidimangrovimonas sediminis]